MAKYDYKCEQCNQVNEIEKSIKDSDLKELCPQCDAEMVRQVSRGTSFSLKGDGWFKKGGY